MSDPNLDPQPCPHCKSTRNFRACPPVLEWRTTERGRVLRCWQCGGEWRFLSRVWPHECAVHDIHECDEADA